MTTLSSSNGSLESSNTGTNNHHLLALRCWNNLHTLNLTTDKRINGTTASEGNRTLSHTGIATQTLHNAVFLASHNLLWVEWICKQLTAHINNVSLTLGNDTFHLLWVAKRTDSSNRLLHVFLDLGCKPYVHTVLIEHRRRGVEESELIRTGRYVNEVNELFNCLSNLNTVLNAIATIEQLATTKTYLDREIRPNGIAHRGKNLTNYADSVLKRATILISTMIEIWR